MTNDEPTDDAIRVGDYVTDADDTDSDPDRAVVIRLPDATCAETDIESIGKTVAECNPDYEPDARVGLIAFEPALDAKVPQWKERNPDDLHDLVRESDATVYSYPVPRLDHEGRAVKETVRVWFDGACEPMNPGGHGTYGVTARKDGEVVYEVSEYLGAGEGMTNNVAEYEAVIGALEFLSNEYPNCRGIVHGDSELVVKQLTGEYAVRSERLWPLWKQARSIASDLDVEFRWVPREENERADALSVAAYEEEAHQEEIEKRRKRAREEEMDVEHVEGDIYRAKGKYRVDLAERSCTCPDYDNRGITCKHVFGVERVVEAAE